MPEDVVGMFLRKACDCEDATASGPRVVHAGAQVIADCLQFTAQLVVRACDRCDTPWEEIEDDDALS